MTEYEWRIWSETMASDETLPDAHTMEPCRAFGLGARFPMYNISNLIVCGRLGYSGTTPYGFWNPWDPWVFGQPTIPMSHRAPFFHDKINPPDYIGMVNLSEAGSHVLGINVTPPSDHWWGISGEIHVCESTYCQDLPAEFSTKSMGFLAQRGDQLIHDAGELRIAGDRITTNASAIEVRTLLSNIDTEIVTVDYPHFGSRRCMTLPRRNPHRAKGSMLTISAQ